MDTPDPAAAKILSLGSILRYDDRRLVDEGRLDEAIERVGRRYSRTNLGIQILGVICIGLALTSLIGNGFQIGTLGLALLATVAIVSTIRQDRKIKQVLDEAAALVDSE